MKLELPRQIFEKYSDIKLRENPSRGSRVVPCGHTERYDEAKVDFRSFANVKNKECCLVSGFYTHCTKPWHDFKLCFWHM